MFVQIDDFPTSIKNLARRLRRRSPSRRNELRDNEIERFIVDTGVNRVWEIFDKITSPPRATAAE
jgi:hypothetical protein